MKKINVCILTHGRPQLFKRCINALNMNLATLSTLQKTRVNFIILCDDGSVNERQVKLQSDNVKFIAVDEPEDIADNYKRLFRESKTTSEDDYTYFMEDDDFLLGGSLKIMLNMIWDMSKKDKADNFLFKYNHGYGKEFDNNFTNRFKFLKINNFNGRTYKIEDFLKVYDDEHYQLGMLLFKNSCLKMLDFPKGNYLENDFEIFKALSGTVEINATSIYQQGFFNKGSVNISDKNIKESKFKSLKDYIK